MERSVTNQRSSSGEIHDKVKDMIFEDHFVQVDDVVVLDSGKRANLVLDQFDLGDAAKLGRVDDLDSDDLIYRSIPFGDDGRLCDLIESISRFARRRWLRCQSFVRECSLQASPAFSL